MSPTTDYLIDLFAPGLFLAIDCFARYTFWISALDNLTVFGLKLLKNFDFVLFDPVYSLKRSSSSFY